MASMAPPHSGSIDRNRQGGEGRGPGETGVTGSRGNCQGVARRAMHSFHNHLDLFIAQCYIESHMKVILSRNIEIIIKCVI